MVFKLILIQLILQGPPVYLVDVYKTLLGI